jgi:hypothetical protein
MENSNITMSAEIEFGTKEGKSRTENGGNNTTSSYRRESRDSGALHFNLLESD